MSTETKEALGIAELKEILTLLPHRYPFLLVDKIIEIDGDNSAIGIKNVTVNEPQFTGHFPDQPYRRFAGPAGARPAIRTA